MNKIFNPPKAKRFTRLDYEKLLNETCTEPKDGDSWIDNQGTFHRLYARNGRYGSFLRRFKPIQFDNQYMEYQRNIPKIHKYEAKN